MLISLVKGLQAPRASPQRASFGIVFCNSLQAPMQCGACNAPDDFIARLDLCLVMLLGACKVPLHLPNFLTHPIFKLSILLAKCIRPVILGSKYWRFSQYKPAHLSQLQMCLECTQMPA